MVRKREPREPGPYARAHMGTGGAEPAKPKKQTRKTKPPADAPADDDK